MIQFGGNKAQYPVIDVEQNVRGLVDGRPFGTYSVTEFGAKGDGVNLDDVAIQEALDRAEGQGGGVVYLPPGRYALGKTIFVGSNTTLWGAGRNTILTDAFPPAGQAFSPLILSNKGIRAGGYAGARDIVMGNFTVDTTTSGIGCAHAENVTFTDIWGVDCLFHHFDICGAKNVTVKNFHLAINTGTASSVLQIDNAVAEGAYYTWDGSGHVTALNDGTGTENVHIHDGFIDATGVTYGIQLHRSGGKNITISNVTITGGNEGIWSDNESTWQNVTVENCTFNNQVNRAMAFRSPPPGNTNSGLVVSNTVVTGARYGMLLAIGWTDVRIHNLTGNVVTKANEGNVTLNACARVAVSGVASAGDTAIESFGVKLENGGRDFTINNSIFADHKDGVRVMSGKFEGITITGTHFTNCGTSVYVPNASGGAEDWVIAGCSFYTPTAATWGDSMRFVWVDKGARVTVANCVLKGHTYQGIALANITRGIVQGIMADCTITNGGSSGAIIALHTATGILVENVNSQAGNGPSATGTSSVTLTSATSAVRITNCHFAGTNNGIRRVSGVASATFNGVIFAGIATPTNIESPPNSGTYEKGDTIQVVNPVPGGFIGIVCTAAGTPGTWKGYGAVEA